MHTPQHRRPRGFTLLELILVISIMALATAGVSLALRDGGDALLEREAVRLAALLESGRAQSRAAGVPVRWRALGPGFAFEGLPGGQLAGSTGGQSNNQWLDAGTQVVGPNTLVLGPEPIIAPQAVVLSNQSFPGRSLRVASDGLRPFEVTSTP
jgi:general secretion pathway protein H